MTLGVGHHFGLFSRNRRFVQTGRHGSYCPHKFSSACRLSRAFFAEKVGVWLWATAGNQVVTVLKKTTGTLASVDARATPWIRMTLAATPV
jgi:hypothetical protein